MSPYNKELEGLNFLFIFKKADPEFFLTIPRKTVVLEPIEKETVV